MRLAIVVVAAVALSACAASPAERRQAALEAAVASGCVVGGRFQMSDACIQASCARLPGETLAWCPEFLSASRQSFKAHGCMDINDEWALRPEACQAPRPHLTPEVAQAVGKWADSPAVLARADDPDGFVAAFLAATAIREGASTRSAERLQAELEAAATRACGVGGGFQMSDACIQASCARLPGETLAWCPEMFSARRQSFKEHGCMTEENRWQPGQGLACSTPTLKVRPEVEQGAIKWAMSPAGRRTLASTTDGRAILSEMPPSGL